MDYYLHFSDTGEDEDIINYSVSYQKINLVAFKTEKTVGEGIDELIKACQIFELKHPYNNFQEKTLMSCADEIHFKNCNKLHLVRR